MAAVLQIMRYLALSQCVIGFLMFLFGAVDRGVVHFWTSHIGFPIWIGVWITATGVIGFCASSRLTSIVNHAMIGVYMGFSITSTVLSGIIIICYSVVLAIKTRDSIYGPQTLHDYHDGGTYLYGDSGYSTAMAISSIILLLGVAQFFLGVWAAVCCCQACGCQCCGIDQEQPGQVMYAVNQNAQSTTHILAQNPTGVGMGQVSMTAMPTSGGAMVAVPMQVRKSGQPVVALPVAHGGSPMATMQVQQPASMAPIMAIPAQPMSHVQVQQPTSGAPIMTVPAQPMSHVQVQQPASMAPIMAIPAQPMSHVQMQQSASMAPIMAVPAQPMSHVALMTPHDMSHVAVPMSTTQAQEHQDSLLVSNSENVNV